MIPPRPTTRLSAPAFATIVTETTIRTDGLETGGILLGHTLPDGSIHVTNAGTPGPNATREARFFRRDPNHAQQLADTAYTRDQSVWVGDWHTHPLGPTHPSDIDLHTYTRLLDDAELDFATFLAIIVVPESHPVLYPWQVTTQAASLTALIRDPA